jgi:hypothetical protein
MGMGNAMSAVTTGNLVSYYNPVFTFSANNLLGWIFIFIMMNR